MQIARTRSISIFHRSSALEGGAKRKRSASCSACVGEENARIAISVSSFSFRKEESLAPACIAGARALRQAPEHRQQRLQHPRHRPEARRERHGLWCRVSRALESEAATPRLESVSTRLVRPCSCLHPQAGPILQGAAGHPGRPAPGARADAPLPRRAGADALAPVRRPDRAGAPRCGPGTRWWGTAGPTRPAPAPCKQLRSGRALGPPRPQGRAWCSWGTWATASTAQGPPAASSTPGEVSFGRKARWAPRPHRPCSLHTCRPLRERARAGTSCLALARPTRWCWATTIWKVPCACVVVMRVGWGVAGGCCRHCGGCSPLTRACR